MSTTTITITNKSTGETCTLSRDVTHTHPGWVHDQLHTGSEAELQDALDRLSVWDYYDCRTGEHEGPDDDGLSVMLAEPLYQATYPCYRTTETLNAATDEEAEEEARAGYVDEDGDGEIKSADIVRYQTAESEASAWSIDLQPDHSSLIEEAVRYSEIEDTCCGSEPEDHDWTSEGEGGCDENPGVWSTGGTTIVSVSHCRRCGLRRTETLLGPQRNPWECDTVKYAAPVAGAAD